MVETLVPKECVLGFVANAMLAPSSHNTQPWLFDAAENRVELWADRTRALPANDPEDRELVQSCGAALFNLRVAVAHAGFVPLVKLLPKSAESDLLARVSWPTEGRAPEAELFDAIAKRRTYRRRFAKKPVPEGAVRALEHAAELEGAWLGVLETDARRHAAAALVAHGDAAQWASPSWRRELAAWMHPRRRGDGLTLPGLAVPVAQLVVRTFDMGHGTGARDRELADGSPLLAVLGTPGDTVEDWLAAGQALQRVLLTAVTLGLQASYLNQPIQVPALRPKLAHLLSREGSPQQLLRFGAPTSELPPSPRRPLTDVLLEDQALA
ncbi:MAG: nitroreductase [Planctomycetes bacterium]|nr:nitroreductase [Planctomycetota bacterium]